MLNIPANQTSGRENGTESVTYRSTVNRSKLRWGKNVAVTFLGFFNDDLKSDEEKVEEERDKFWCFAASWEQGAGLLYPQIKSLYSRSSFGAQRVYPSHVNQHLICGRRRLLGMNAGGLKTSSQYSLLLLTGSLFTTLWIFPQT